MYGISRRGLEPWVRMVAQASSQRCAWEPVSVAMGAEAAGTNFSASLGTA
ncbi:MAG: hypothetical protein RL385_1737 [Pseudomonadota bacterium]|jgi:hypothetical protein